MNSKKLIQSYVFCKTDDYFVSTIESDSSAMTELPPPRYNETLVWKWDAKNRECKELIYTNGGASGTPKEHFTICERLYLGTLF